MQFIQKYAIKRKKQRINGIYRKQKHDGRFKSCHIDSYMEMSQKLKGIDCQIG